MVKHIHEVRDPIHGFITLDTAERKVLDSRPFQRLRHIRRIYDLHLQEFLQATLPDGRYPIDPEEHLRTTDNEILTRIRDAAWRPEAAGHEPAVCIMGRKHFRVLYRRTSGDPVIMLQRVYRGASGTRRYGEISSSSAVPRMIFRFS